MKFLEHIRHKISARLGTTPDQRLQPADRFTAEASGMRWKQPMPVGTRIFLFFMGIACVAVSLVALVAIALVVYSFFS